MGFRVCRLSVAVKRWRHREAEGLLWSNTAEPSPLLSLSY